VRRKLAVCLGLGGRIGCAAYFYGKGRQREFEF
jgi:hypothetical protein